MDLDPISIFSVVFQVFKSFFSSGFFWFIKLFLAVYVAVLFVDMVLLLIIRGLGGDLRDTIKGGQVPMASKKKMQKRWSLIEERLETNQIAQFKAAILEADKMADEILASIGYGGSNMKERLEKANNNQVEEIDNLIEGHAIRNRIIQEENFVLNKGEAQRVLGLYKEFLENLEMI